MDQADANLRECFGQRCRRGFGSLRLQMFRFLDQRTDPVGLRAAATGIAHARDHFCAPSFRKRDGRNRRSPWRQFTDDRCIEIRVDSHGQRARNRRCCHHQLMWAGSVARALVHQLQPLMHAEAMLLIHDHQR